jgi:hypothetical protein
MRPSNLLIVAYIAMWLLKSGLLAAEQGVPYDLYRIDSDFSREHFIESHTSSGIFNWTMIDSLLDVFINEFQDEVLEFSFQTLPLKHLEERSIESLQTVMSCESQVGEILTQVVHDDYFISQDFLYFSVHHFEGLAFDPSVIFDPLF